MKNLSVLLLFIFFAIVVKAHSCEPKPIDVEVTGSGEPILFIPGFTVPGEIWNPIVNELSKSHECHVVTLAGFGGTEPIAFPWLPKVNQAIESYIKDNELNDVTIIGHSLGGTIATWLAAQNDNSIKKLILVDALPAAGALMIPDYNPDNLVYESPYNDQQLQMNDEQFEQMSSMMSNAMSLKKEGQEKVQQWMMQADRKTYVYGYTDYLKLDLREELKNINIPVTILAATQPYGTAMVKQTNQTQYENLKNYDLILANDAAHFIMLDQPEWFYESNQPIISSRLMNIQDQFDTIYEQHKSRVYKLCLGYASGDTALAKDWLQEVFIKVWKHRKTFKGESSISTWIYRITVNTCLSDLRKSKLTTTLKGDSLSLNDENVQPVDTSEQIHKMYQCIDQLTTQNKTLILLELEEIPQATIAQTVGLAHGTLRTRLSRIRKSLLKCITNGK